MSNQLKKELQKLYKKYNHWKFISPDPLQFLYDYETLEDREVVGLIASALAFGKVDLILSCVQNVLNKMGKSPHDYLKNSSKKKIQKNFEGFQYRYIKGPELIELLLGMKSILEKFETLGNAFAQGYKPQDQNILPALENFVNQIFLSPEPRYLAPSPSRGSACKRWNLFLRWMVRKDEVDPGGWDFIGSDKLIQPLDTHIFKISKSLGITSRNQADLKTAIEITEFFKKIEPSDPLKYDFSLTRLGIWGILELNDLVSVKKTSRPKGWGG